MFLPFYSRSENCSSAVKITWVYKICKKYSDPQGTKEITLKKRIDIEEEKQRHAYSTSSVKHSI